MIAADVFTIAAGFCAFCIVLVLALAVAFAWREDHDRTLAELRHIRETRLQIAIDGAVIFDLSIAHIRIALGMMNDGETVLDETIPTFDPPTRRLTMRMIQP